MTKPKEDFVILVDEADNEIGLMEKLEAHKKAVLHRAISVFIFNSKGEWLLQRRALQKYHSNGLWSNTSCSHPLPGEPVIEAAQRRLLEEMGLQTDLEEAFWFIYREKLDNNLTEYELDHVFIGFTDEHPKINPNEVTNWKYITSDDLEMDINKNPEKYTAWFKIIVERVSREYKRNKKVRKSESKTIEL